MDRIKSKNYGPNPLDYRGFKNKYLEVIEYASKSTWKCKCACGKEFKSRTNKIKSRKGCRSCTSSITSAKRNHKIPHYGYINRLYKDYKSGAKKRNLKFELSLEEFYDIITKNCSYCGQEPIEHINDNIIKTIDPPKHNGVDRIDSSKGYLKKNVTSCCSKCNYAKHEMNIEDFKFWIKKVYNNLIEKSSTTIP